VDKVYCAACGAEFDEDPALPSEQRPSCPACGARSLERSITDCVVLSDSGAAFEAIGVTRTTGSATLAQAQTAAVTMTAHDATVHAEDAPADAEPTETEALVTQGFGLWWHQLTASPPTWMAQVFDAAGEPLATVVGDDLVQLYADLAEWLLPHHPG
jgi:DNA-directed RNA polymerase subunit RPC12/RpoP